MSFVFVYIIRCALRYNVLFSSLVFVLCDLGACTLHTIKAAAGHKEQKKTCKKFKVFGYDGPVECFTRLHPTSVTPV